MPKTKEVTVKPVERLKSILATDSVKDQFQNAMAENSGLFIASLIDIYGGDKSLQKCEPGAVVMEALKAAVLKLPLNKNLGFAWLIAYKQKGVFTPNFQIGYRGYIQLALRSGNYRYINADVLYKGHKVSKDLLTGNCVITGKAENDKAIGYFAYIELLNGFKKSIFWTRKEVEIHAKRFSKSYGTSFSPWKTDFDQMAIKTVLTAILKKYGILSVEMASALGGYDLDQHLTPEGQLEKNVKESANKETIDIESESSTSTAESESDDIPPNLEMSEEEKAEIEAEESGRNEHQKDMPGF